MAKRFQFSSGYYYNIPAILFEQSQTIKDYFEDFPDAKYFELPDLPFLIERATVQDEQKPDRYFLDTTKKDIVKLLVKIGENPEEVNDPNADDLVDALKLSDFLGIDQSYFDNYIEDLERNQDPLLIYIAYQYGEIPKLEMSFLEAVDMTYNARSEPSRPTPEELTTMLDSQEWYDPKIIYVRGFRFPGDIFLSEDFYQDMSYTKINDDHYLFRGEDLLVPYFSDGQEKLSDVSINIKTRSLREGYDRYLFKLIFSTILGHDQDVRDIRSEKDGTYYIEEFSLNDVSQVVTEPILDSKVPSNIFLAIPAKSYTKLNKTSILDWKELLVE